ncbi:DNA polymerase IV [Azovibrio restrictus]|uniref:DNA polymerase IV n=1 Tax=Azovibrio restrictus TaxID=146938 RepID=UPI0026EA06DE|nr:DNA polymerase IV [Azovibrio restrictus]MDD3483906.1 DNA polymerase IV [Azovibrio restrictus]
MNSNRRIAHLDMDAFFASVELRFYPELQGQAVVVGGARVHAPETLADGSRRFARLRDYAGRGVVTTSTYEARALGVFSGMGLMKSAQLAPEAILLPAQFEAYRDYSRRFKAAVAAIAPTIEDRGIDEIYLDLTDHPEPTLPLVQRLKGAVLEATGLSCSVGVAPNKLLAKICSDLDKPDGITLLEAADIPTRIWPLAPRKINGIGPKAAARLERLGIDSIGALAATPEDFLVRHFGAGTGAWLHRAAHGVDHSPVVTSREPKSISRETTFERDLHVRLDRPELSRQFTALCERVAADLARKGYLSRTIGIKLRYEDFQAVTRDVTLPVAVGDAAAIRRAAGECLKRVPLERKIRLLGVRCGALVPQEQESEETEERQGKLPF